MSPSVSLAPTHFLNGHGEARHNTVKVCVEEKCLESPFRAHLKGKSVAYDKMLIILLPACWKRVICTGSEQRYFISCIFYLLLICTRSEQRYFISCQCLRAQSRQMMRKQGEQNVQTVQMMTMMLTRA